MSLNEMNEIRDAIKFFSKELKDMTINNIELINGGETISIQLEYGIKLEISKTDGWKVAMVG